MFLIYTLLFLVAISGWSTPILLFDGEDFDGRFEQAEERGGFRHWCILACIVALSGLVGLFAGKT